MTTTIYGVSGSRAIRSLWAIEETGIEYNHVATHFFKDSKSDDYLAVNPNGRIPALIDGDLTLFESMAINLYLTKKHAPALYPADPALEAKANQWTVWGISEIEPLQMQIVVQKFFAGDNKDQKIIDQATESLNRPLDVLNTHLAGSDYLLGDSFTVADLNVAGVMLLLDMVGFDMSGFPNVQAWTARCYAREALTRAQALD
ncbi:MAG: glutathione S-transferase [Candidatus Azotimanducaceae bacterium]|jgi:glutathione S-transferase